MSRKRSIQGQGREGGYRMIVARMRRRIMDGRWPLGGRIPTKRALCGEFGASDATLQRALNVLGREGYLHSRGCLGTWVSSTPPHLSHVGLVFPANASRSIYWRALQTEAERLAAAWGWQVKTYVDCMRPFGPDYDRLHDDLHHRRLAGLVSLVPSESLLRADQVEGTGVVIVSLIARPGLSGEYRVCPTADAADAVFDYLAAKGRRRMALLMTFSSYAERERLAALAAGKGLELPDMFLHPIGYDTPGTACAIMELIMASPTEARPDAVYIMDDHLATQATLGLARGGAETGPDAPIDVVSMANFPHLPEVHVATTFHGYDSRAMIATAFGVVQRRLAGEQPDRLIRLSPVFAAELR